MLSIVVESDTANPDAATVTLDPGRAKLPAIGEALNVDAMSGGKTVGIFTGEIVGVEPAFDASGASRVLVRALNRLHRLTRGRLSRTYEKRSDAEVATEIARKAGLEFGPTGPEAGVGYEHIVQHDQTDLEFLRDRAARIGYEVIVDDTTLYFQRHRDLPPILLGCAPTRAGSRALLKVFHPRISSANVVSKVTVRGWDPKKQEDIVATATRRLIPLSPAGSRVTDPPGSLLDLGVVRALDSAVASYGAAIGTLSALTADDLSGEADTDGHAALRAGALVYLQDAGQAFDGDYRVVGASHRFERGSNDGWHTLLRVARADRGVFVLPEVGDEVLVAFENGDLAHPIVVGSLWHDADRPPETPFCRPGSLPE